MTERTWRNEMVRFLSEPGRTEGTRRLYQHDIEQYREWCEELGYTPLGADESQVHEYGAHLRAIHAKSTVSREINTLRIFFQFLVRRGVLSENPAADLRVESPQISARQVPDIEQLRRLWDVSVDDDERLAVGLLGICGLKPRELNAAQTHDLGQVDDLHVLRVVGRQNRHQRPHVALPPAVADVAERIRSDRGSGPLIRTGWGNEHNRNTLRTMTRRIGERADLGYDLNPLDLTYCLRAIAIERGFGYADLVRSIGEMEPRRLSLWVDRFPGRLEDHPALRLGRLVLSDSSESESQRHEAELMLTTSDAHPAAAAAYAGAVIERHLRQLALSNDIDLEGHQRLSAYGAKLKQRDLIDYRTLQSLNKAQDIRNDAAHGWFERVSKQDAWWLVRFAKELLATTPVSEPEQR